MTTGLAVFGGGGIGGNILIGLGMTFGPMAERHFTLFVVNNLVFLAAAGISFLVACVA